MATVVTNIGKGVVWNRMIGSGTEAKFVAWGTGTTTAAATQTALVTESAEARTSGTSSRITTTTTNDTYQVTGTITSTSSQTIAESGLFDASTTGNMFTRGDFTGVALLNGESIAFTWTVQLT